MKQIFRNKKIWLMSVIVICIAIWWGVKHFHRAPINVPDAVLVNVEKVKQGEIAVEANAVGALVAAQNVQLTPEVAGKVSEILVSNGSFVKKGTPLIQLDDTVYKAKAESAKANLNYSAANYNRMVILGKKGAISQQAIDQALADFKEKKAAAEESRILAEKMRIIAPFDGNVGKIKVSPGEYVAVGQALGSFTDTHHLRVEFNISEKYYSQLKIGQQVTLMTSTYPEKIFHGKISFISPTINTEDRTISTYADVPNDNGLLTAGLFVNVKHALGSVNNALLIPAVSLVATIDGQQVFKVINNKVNAVQVTLGQRTENEVQITSGLTLGDMVVTAGQQKIKDGMVVKTQ